MSDAASGTDFLTRRIHLVTGKGGVGRTTIAASLAEAAASHGKRVLLTQIDDPGGGPSAIGRCFGRETLTPDPEPLGPPRLEGCHVQATRGQELFAHSVVPAGPLIRSALRSSTLRKFVSAVPSLFELGVFYHLLTLLQAEHGRGAPRHEIIVADMPATGQTLALTSLPEVLLDALPDGPIPRYMRQGQAFLNDPAKGMAWVVTLPELLPATEALELAAGLRETHVHVGGVLLNRVPADPFSPDERAALERLLEERSMHGELAIRQNAAAREARSLIVGESGLTPLDLPERAEVSDAGDRRALVRALATWMAPG